MAARFPYFDARLYTLIRGINSCETEQGGISPDSLNSFCPIIGVQSTIVPLSDYQPRKNGTACGGSRRRLEKGIEHK